MFEDDEVPNLYLDLSLQDNQDASSKETTVWNFKGSGTGPTVLDGATAKSTKYAMTYSCCFCGTTFVVYKRNIKHLLCLHSLMQTLEGVWENSEVFV